MSNSAASASRCVVELAHLPREHAIGNDLAARAVAGATLRRWGRERDGDGRDVVPARECDPRGPPLGLEPERVDHRRQPPPQPLGDDRRRAARTRRCWPRGPLRLRRPPPAGGRSTRSARARSGSLRPRRLPGARRPDEHDEARRRQHDRLGVIGCVGHATLLGRAYCRGAARQFVIRVENARAWRGLRDSDGENAGPIGRPVSRRPDRGRWPGGLGGGRTRRRRGRQCRGPAAGAGLGRGLGRGRRGPAGRHRAVATCSATQSTRSRHRSRSSCSRCRSRCSSTRSGSSARSRRRSARARHLRLALWCLAGAVTVLFNLDAAVVLLTPLYVRIARRHGDDIIALAFIPALLASLASSVLPVSNLTNLVLADQLHLGVGDFLVHAAPAALAATIVGWFAYRRTAGVEPSPRACTRARRPARVANRRAGRRVPPARLHCSATRSASRRGSSPGSRSRSSAHGRGGSRGDTSRLPRSRSPSRSARSRSAPRRPSTSTASCRSTARRGRRSRSVRPSSARTR